MFEEEKPKEKELGCEEGDESDWGYCPEEQLEDIMIKSLDFFYNEAVCKIVSEGCTREEALRAVLQSGHLYGGGDLLSDIVENAIPYLNNEAISSPTGGADIVFRDLKQLEEYALTRMVCILQQNRPKLTKGEAIWCLLMSDLHLGKASNFEIPPSVDERSTIRSNGNNGPSPSTVIYVPSPIRASSSASNFMSSSEPCKMCAAKKRTSGLNNTVQDGRPVICALPATHNNAFTFDVGTSQAPCTQFMPNACVPSSAKLSLMRRNTASGRKAATLLPARSANDRKSKSDTISQQLDGGNSKDLISNACSSGKEQTQSRNNLEKKKQVEQEMNSQMENAVDANSVVAPATELSLGLDSPVDSGQDQYRGTPANAT